MTQTYRTNDFTKWGSGKGSNLTPTEVDINFWDLIQRMETQEARPDPSAGIDYFSITGTSLYVHMTDATIRGPYTLPTAFFNATGEWEPSTAYSVLDTFTINGGLYSVIFAHTSDVSFDPAANDGAGHDYYALMIQTPGSALPTGGSVTQVLEKSTTSDYAVTWGWKLPIDGTTRQYLIKQSNGNQDADWNTPQADDIEFTSVTGSVLSSDNVADALEEILTSIHASDVSFSPATGSILTSLNVADALEEILTSIQAPDVDFTPVTGSSLTSTNVADALEELATASSVSGLLPVNNLSDVSSIVTARFNLGLSDAAIFAVATAAQYRNNTADKVLTTDKVWSAASPIILTDASSIAVDMSTFINASVTLGGNRTLANPTNPKMGQSGVIRITQDGTGSRTLAYDTNWKFAGRVAPTLSTAANADDLLFYHVISSTFIYATLVLDVG